MKKLFSGIAVLMFVFAPMAFAVDDGEYELPEREGVYCIFKDTGTQTYTIVEIPDKKAVIEKCEQYGGIVKVVKLPS